MNLRHLVFPGCVLLVCLWTSCGRSGSVSSAVASSYEGDTVPETPRTEEGLAVVPDVLVVPFAFRQETEDLKGALSELQKAVQQYESKAKAATNPGAEAKLLGFGQEYGKRMGGSEALVHGQLEVALPESLKFWERAALVATLTQVGNQQAAEAENAKKGLRAAFGFPEARVRDPEAHRAELMKRWVERARSFMSQAQSERAPLQLVNCEPPGQVTQQPVAVDKVVLSLAMSCRLDAVAK